MGWGARGRGHCTQLTIAFAQPQRAETRLPEVSLGPHTTHQRTSRLPSRDTCSRPTRTHQHPLDIIDPSVGHGEV